MKVVDLETFIALPAGTVYSKIDPHGAFDFGIKGESILESRDFFYTPLSVNDVEGILNEIGDSCSADFETESRDGTFADVPFIVLDHEDVRRLQGRIWRAFNQGYGVASWTRCMSRRENLDHPQLTPGFIDNAIQTLNCPRS